MGYMGTECEHSECAETLQRMEFEVPCLSAGFEILHILLLFTCKLSCRK